MAKRTIRNEWGDVELTIPTKMKILKMKTKKWK